MFDAPYTVNTYGGVSTMTITSGNDVVKDLNFSDGDRLDFHGQDYAAAYDSSTTNTTITLYSDAAHTNVTGTVTVEHVDLTTVDSANWLSQNTSDWHGLLVA